MTPVIDDLKKGVDLLAMRWVEEFRSSIKAPEAEDRIDLAFYRPLGFVLAKLGGLAGASPTHLTLLGAFCGLAAGTLFFSQQSHLILWAMFLLLLAGILDSADGQLARLSGRSSQFGLVLDGLCDNIVFSAVYIGCTLPLMADYGAWIWLLAFPAGFSHSLQSSLLDFFNREYLFYTEGSKGEGYWNPLLSDAPGRKSWLDRLRATWLYQQEALSPRKPKMRLALRQEKAKNPRLPEIYRRHNLVLLRLWRPLGANFHTLGILCFAAMGKFEYYLLFVDLIFLNLWLFLAIFFQSRADKKMFEELGLREGQWTD